MYLLGLALFFIFGDSIEILKSCCNFEFLCFLQLGSTAIGIQTSEGVVLAVEKRVTSPLIEAGSIEKIMEVDKHIGEEMRDAIL